MGKTFDRSRSAKISARVAQHRLKGCGVIMILVLVHILIIVVIGAIVFWVIDKYARDRRLANLLKLLVILICLAAILQRLLPVLGVSF